MNPGIIRVPITLPFTLQSMKEKWLPEVYAVGRKKCGIL